MSPSGDFKLTRTWRAGVESPLPADAEKKNEAFNDLIKKVKGASEPAFDGLKDIFSTQYTVEFVKTESTGEIQATFAKKAGGAPVTHTFKLIDSSAPPSPRIDPELLATLRDMWNAVMVSPALAGASGLAHTEAPLLSSAAPLGAASLLDTIDPARLETLTHLNEYLNSAKRSHSEEVQNRFIQKVEDKRFTGTTDTIFKASDLALLGDEKALKLLDISLLEDIRACITVGKFKEAALTITLLDEHNKFAILTSLGMADSISACTFSNTDFAFITELAETLKTPGKHLGIEGLIGSEIARVKDEISELKAQAYVHQMTAGYEREIASYQERIRELEGVKILTADEATALRALAEGAEKSAAVVAKIREALEGKLREKIRLANARAVQSVEAAKELADLYRAAQGELATLGPKNAALRDALAASQTEVGRLRAALEKAHIAVRRAQEQTQTTLERLQAERAAKDAAEAQVAALTAANLEAQRTIAAFPAERKALQRTHAEATAALEAQHAAALDGLRRDHAAATEALTAANARALAEAQEGYRADIARLQAAQAAELDALRGTHAGELGSLTAEKAAALERARDAEGKLARAREAGAVATARIESLSRDLAASEVNVRRLEAEAETKVAEHAAALADQAAQHEAAFEALRRTTDTEKAEALRVVEEAAQRAAREAEVALSDVRAQLARSKEVNAGLRRELAEVKKAKGLAEGRLEFLERALARTTADVRSLYEQRGRLIEDLSAKADRLLEDRKIAEERKGPLRDAKGAFDAASASLASQEAQLPVLLESTQTAFEASNAKEAEIALASASGKAVPKGLSAESLERKLALASAQAAYGEAFALVQETRAGVTASALELSAAMEEVSKASAGDLAARLETATRDHSAASSAAQDLSSQLASARRENEELKARNGALTVDLEHNAAELSEAGKKLARQTGIVALQQKTLMRLADENKDLRFKMKLQSLQLLLKDAKIKAAQEKFTATLAGKEEHIRDLGARLAENETTLSALREEKGRVDEQLGKLVAEKEGNLAEIARLRDLSTAQSIQIDSLTGQKDALSAELLAKEGVLTLARQEIATSLAKIKAQGGELAKLTKKLESTETARDAALRERDEAKEAVASLKATFARGLEEAQRLFEERLAPLSSRLREAEEKQSALTAANRELTSRAEAAERTVADLTAANAALKASGAASLEENEGLRAALEAAIGERDHFAAQLADIKAEIGDAASVSTFVAAQAAALNKGHEASLAERQAAHEAALAAIERTLGERSRTFEAASAESAAALRALQAELRESSDVNARQADALDVLAGRASVLEKELSAFREEFNSLEQALLGQVATLPTIEARKERLVAHVKGLDGQIAALKEENEGLKARLTQQAREHAEAMVELSSRLTAEKAEDAARALVEIGALTSARDEALRSLEASQADVERMTALDAAKTKRIAGLEAAILLLGSDRKRLQGIQKAQEARLSSAKEEIRSLRAAHLEAIGKVSADLAAMTEARDDASSALAARKAEFAAATEAFESEKGRLDGVASEAQKAATAAARQFGEDKAALEARFKEQEAALRAEIASLTTSGAASARDAAAQIAQMNAELETLRALKGSVAQLNITDEAGVAGIQEAVAGIQTRLSAAGVDVRELNFTDLPSLINRLGAALIENKAFKEQNAALEAQIAALTEAHARKVADLTAAIEAQTRKADATEATLTNERARFTSELEALRASTGISIRGLEAARDAALEGKRAAEEDLMAARRKFEEKMGETQEKLRKAQGSIQDLQRELDALGETLGTKTAAFAEKASALEASEAKAVGFEEEIAALKAAHEKQVAGLQATFAAERERLEASQRALEGQLEDLRGKLSGEKATTAAQVLEIARLEGLLSAKGDVEGALAKAVAATTAAQEENAALVARHAAALSDLRSQLVEKTTLEGALRADIAKLEKQAAAATRALETESAAKAALREEFDALEIAAQEETRKTLELGRQKAALETHLKANSQAIIEKLNAAIPGFEAPEVASLTGEALIGQHRALTGSLFTLYAANLATIEAQKSALAEASRLHADLSLQLGEKQGALDSAGRSKGEVDRALGQALAENARLQGVVNDITPQFEASEATVARLTEELSSAKTATLADKAEIARLTESLQKATAANGALNAAKLEAEAALGEAEATSRSLRETLAQREAFIAQKQREIETLTSEVEAAERKAAALSGDLSDKKAENARLSSVLREAQTATRTAEAATSAKESELERERAAFIEAREKLLAQQRQALDKMAAENAATIARMESEYQAALGVLRTEHEAALARALGTQQEALRAEFAKAMADREEIHLEAVAKVKAQFTELEAEHRALQEAASERGAEVARLSGELRTLRDVTLPASEAARVAALKEAAGVRSELMREGIKFTAEIARLTAAIETMTGQKLEALNLDLTASQIRRELDEIPGLREGLVAKSRENAALIEKIERLEATATEISQYFERLILWLNSQDETVGLGEILSQMAAAKDTKEALTLNEIAGFVGDTIEAYRKALSEKQAGLSALLAQKESLQAEYDDLVGALESAEGAAADAEARARAKDPATMKARIAEQLERIRGVNLRIQRQEADIQRLSTQLPAIERKNATLLRENMEKGRLIVELESQIAAARAEIASLKGAKASVADAGEALTAALVSHAAKATPPPIGGAASARHSPAASSTAGRGARVDMGVFVGEALSLSDLRSSGGGSGESVSGGESVVSHASGRSFGTRASVAYEVGPWLNDEVPMRHVIELLHSLLSELDSKSHSIGEEGYKAMLAFEQAATAAYEEALRIKTGKNVAPTCLNDAVEALYSRYLELSPGSSIPRKELIGRYEKSKSLEEAQTDIRRFFDTANSELIKIANPHARASAGSRVVSPAGSAHSSGRVSPEAAAHRGPMAGGGGGASPSRTSLRDLPEIDALAGNIINLFGKLRINHRMADKAEAVLAFEEEARTIGLRAALTNLAQKHNATVPAHNRDLIFTFIEGAQGKDFAHFVSPAVAPIKADTYFGEALSSAKREIAARPSSSTVGGAALRKAPQAPVTVRDPSAAGNLASAMAAASAAPVRLSDDFPELTVANVDKVLNLITNCATYASTLAMQKAVATFESEACTNLESACAKLAAAFPSITGIALTPVTSRSFTRSNPQEKAAQIKSFIEMIKATAAAEASPASLRTGGAVSSHLYGGGGGALSAAAAYGARLSGGGGGGYSPGSHHHGSAGGRW